MRDVELLLRIFPYEEIISLSPIDHRNCILKNKISSRSAFMIVRKYLYYSIDTNRILSA